MIPYLVVYLWSEEDEAYIAYVPEIRGCTSYGATLPEAGAMIGDAYQSIIEFMAERGETLPTPKPILHIRCNAQTGEVDFLDENGNEL